ncbi:Fe3+-siderophore ABC transporter permease [Paenibacillus helianthi]|uniref:Fe3+-siderophore ABC transporter permease n=2 Tax=Paenibacillus TaxID=44249 RepID=A0ABX3EW22_9BACL|nr:iron ABC transporter permease [Paenibacillus helianthi]OKP89623.1 Fe3+-siderophore ABC transporter permease [Paenibacillus helianthi]OKP93754.1 Fe3+-siderophore ABC transporter permease [Paenibacillus sp. P32E]
MNTTTGKRNSTGMTWRLIGIFGGGFAALFVVFMLSLCFGEAKITATTVWNGLLHRQDIMEHNLLWDIRMPRTVIGILAGAALAAAGALLQTITKNPLASSDTLGINAGAYFMVVLGMVAFPATQQQYPLLLAAAGGLLAALAAYVLSGGRKATPVRLALSGMIVSMVLGAFTSALHIFFQTETQNLFLWGSGSLIQLDWDGVRYAWPFVITLLGISVLAARQFDALELDESTARSLGQRVGLTRAVGLGIAVLMAAIVVSVVGPIGFVGLVAPHLVRLSGIRKHRLLIPASALWGALLITTADTLARMVRSNLGEMPVGAVMAIIGAPWLIWLVLTKMKNISGSGAGQASMNIGGAALRVRFTPAAIFMTLLLILTILVSLSLGGTRIPVSDLLESLVGGGDQAYSVLLHLRLPRTLVAACGGIALAISGVLIQSAVRNPLADASIIGVTSGAGFGALAVLVVWPGLSILALPVAAIAGGVIAAAFVFTLAWRKALNPSVLILLGIAVSAIGSAGIQAMIVKASLWNSAAFIWLTGSTYGRSWQQFYSLFVLLLVLVPIAYYLGRKFDLLAFGDESSTGFGLPVRGTRLWAMIIGVLLAAGAVASVGTIGFLGLMAPHAVRMMIGHHTRRSIILSGLLGGLLLVVADTVGRTVIAPTEIPSGLIIMLIGAPYFLFLMYRSLVHK